MAEKYECHRGFSFELGICVGEKTCLSVVIKYNLKTICGYHYNNIIRVSDKIIISNYYSVIYSYPIEF